MADDLYREPLQHEYRLKVHAVDTGQPSLSSMAELKVKIPKNNPPIFIGDLHFKVKENEAVGTTVGMLTIEDPDTKEGPVVRYEIRNKKSESWFMKENHES